VVLDNKVREVADHQRKQFTIRPNQRRRHDRQTAKIGFGAEFRALPASIKYLEERTVGPSLGQIRFAPGFRPRSIGMLAVLDIHAGLFPARESTPMWPLILNLIILLGFLVISGADAYVARIAACSDRRHGCGSERPDIERIREEMPEWQNPSFGGRAGLTHAWITIVDST